MRLLRWLLVPVIVLPLAWLFVQGFGRDPRAIASPLIGRPAPGFELATLDGGQLSSDELVGRPYLVNFWASWCIPACVDEHPVLIDAQERHGDELVILGVLYDDAPTDARDFLARYGDGGWAHVIDDGGRLAIEYGVTGPPETFFVDADGIVRDKQFGPLTAEILAEKLGRMLDGLAR